MDCQEQEQNRRQQTLPEQNSVQLKKAKLKALKLLERMDRTEAQLREKLLNAEFAPALVEQAVAYVKSYGYLDDERYVRNYIEYRKDQKSRRQLEQELRFKKGVPSELIQKVYEELEPGDEKALIRKLLEKKHYEAGQADVKQKQRMYQFLLRKGFRAEDVLRVL